MHTIHFIFYFFQYIKFSKVAARWRGGFPSGSPVSSHSPKTCSQANWTYEQDTFYHISLYATWTEAQIYCREVYTDLASIRNSDEHQRVSDLVKFVRYVWIGLFLDVWEWSDQGSSSFRYWAMTQPLNLLKSDCVVMVMASAKCRKCKFQDLIFILFFYYSIFLKLMFIIAISV
uniref:C-type lectin domain-containing protein n=1 Tax=Pygocentrus nattereri TaxID=42514 RepID=A0AAR2KK87_PYGNA